MRMQSFDRLRRDLRPYMLGWSVPVRHEAQAESVSGADLEQSSQGGRRHENMKRLAEGFDVVGKKLC